MTNQVPQKDTKKKQWQCESAGESFLCLAPPSYILHAHSPCLDEQGDLCHHHSYYPHVVCSYCQCFGHDVNSYPYYDVLLNPMLNLMS